MKTTHVETVAGITYSKPTVVLLQETGIGTAELAARTCYDSFDSSENDCVKMYDDLISREHPNTTLEASNLGQVNSIEHSNLLDDLAWTYFHHSILEHSNLTYLIRGTSRAVLQEHARHRIQAISVRSTRYTMSSVINAFVAFRSRLNSKSKSHFIEAILSMDMFVISDEDYCRLEASSIWDKLDYQYSQLGTIGFTEIAIAKSSLHILDGEDPIPQAVFEYLQAGKKKRNVGDSFKHIVTDNWKVDMVVTFNLRSLKNYFGLRDSGSAYFQIRNLAQAMKEVTPSKYLDLIVKGK